jgi:hypothetical protein
VLRLVLLAVVLTVGGCGGGPAASVTPTATPAVIPTVTNPPATPIPGCLPECVTGQLLEPGTVSGEYNTQYFFGGQFTVSVPDGWYGYEDSTSELSIGPAGSEDARLEFWIDIYAASEPSGTRDQSIRRTAEGVTEWFVQKPIIEVIERAPTTFGGLPAESIEYRRRDSAANEDPDCPAELQPCAVEFGYPEWDGSFSEGGPFHSRLVVAEASWGGENHAIYAMFWAIGPAYDDLIDEARAVIESAQLPEGVEP